MSCSTLLLGVLVFFVSFIERSMLISSEYSIASRLNQVSAAVLNTLDDIIDSRMSPKEKLVTFWCSNSWYHILETVDGRISQVTVALIKQENYTKDGAEKDVEEDEMEKNSDVHRSVVVAIDPEYEILDRIKQVDQAIVNAIGFFNNSIVYENNVSFWCSNRNQRLYRQVYINDSNITSKFNFSLPVAFLIHGWFDSVNRTWINNTIAAYIENIDSNICGVDWTRLALTEYSIAATNTRIVAKQLVKFIRYLQQFGVSPKHVTLVGHSFGAQIAGIAGHQLNGDIGRIIGLDPAGWLFTKPVPIDVDERLDRSDAHFVQCIHTNANYFGIGATMNCGHQDYYPNEGLSPQPGCVEPANESGMTYFSVTCSHFKAVQYFQYSLNPANMFKGWKCSLGYYWWDTGFCKSKHFDVFGMYSKQKILGSLYLKTSIFPPYAKTKT